MDNTFKEGAVSLTFDDGWRCIFENALPILEKANLKSTHYIISGCLDDEQFPRYVNVEQAKDLVSRGHEIGCHTASHKDLTTESESIIEEEITLSKKYLEKLFRQIDTFSYPYGKYNNRVINSVKKNHFIAARSTVDGFNDEKTELLLLKCQAVKYDTDLSEVKEWIDYARDNNVWLILMFHQIDQGGREWSSTPEKLQKIADYLVETRANIITVREGAEILKSQR